MEWRVEFDLAADLIRVRAWGTASVEGFIGYSRALSQDPRWRPGLALLVDLRDLDLTPMRSSDIDRLVLFQKTYSDRAAQGPIATVVSRAVDYGIVRMWEAYIAGSGRNHHLATDLEEALAWLWSPRT